MEHDGHQPTCDADRVRILLQELVQALMLFNDFEPVAGQPMTASYGTALILLRRREAGDPEAVGPSLRELGDRLAINKSNVTRMCQRMVRRGHIRLVPCPDDRRIKRVVLTESGHALATEVDRLSVQRFEMALNLLPGQARPRVIEGLTDFVRALQASAGTARDAYLARLQQPASDATSAPSE